MSIMRMHIFLKEKSITIANYKKNIRPYEDINNKYQAGISQEVRFR